MGLALTAANAGHQNLREVISIQQSYEAAAADAAAEYLDALAEADRDLRVGTLDPSQYDAAVDGALAAYGNAYTTASNQRRSNATTAGTQYASTLAIAERVHSLQSSGLYRTYVTGEADAHLQRVTTIADLDQAYAEGYAENWRDAMQGLDTLLADPWSESSLARAEAEVDRVLGSSTTIGTAQTTRDSIVSAATFDRNYRVEVANARHHALAGIDGEHDGSAAALFALRDGLATVAEQRAVAQNAVDLAIANNGFTGPPTLQQYEAAEQELAQTESIDSSVQATDTVAAVQSAPEPFYVEEITLPPDVVAALNAEQVAREQAVDVGSHLDEARREFGRQYTPFADPFGIYADDGALGQSESVTRQTYRLNENGDGFVEVERLETPVDRGDDPLTTGGIASSYSPETIQDLLDRGLAVRQGDYVHFVGAFGDQVIAIGFRLNRNLSIASNTNWVGVGPGAQPPVVYESRWEPIKFHAVSFEHILEDKETTIDQFIEDQLANDAYFDIYDGQYQQGVLDFSEGALTFALHLVPTGAGIDYSIRGEYVEATKAFAGDGLIVVGWWARGLGAANQVRALRAVAAGEAVLSGVAVGQGLFALGDGDTAGAIGYFSEGTLQLLGLGLNVRQLRNAGNTGKLSQPSLEPTPSRSTNQGTLVGAGPTAWTAPNGRTFLSENEYIEYVVHRHRSIVGSARGRAAHTASEIRGAGFRPSNVKLKEGSRNFIPEAVEDLLGTPHIFERKTGGYYSASFDNNIYPATIYAGRNGIPFTLELQGSAQISHPLRRLILTIQKRFGGGIIE